MNAIEKNIITTEKNKLIVLSIDEQYPYLINKYLEDDIVSKWEDFGVIDPDNYRYWLNNYKEIDDLIVTDFENCDKLFQSPYFRLGMVRHMGREFYHFFYVLNEFFLYLKPNAIFYNPSGRFIFQLISSFTSSLQIRNERIL